MEAAFWLLLIGAAYSYAIYPLILMLIPGRRSGVASASSDLPRVSMIVAVHNESAQIREKLENTLAVDYPTSLLDIIVVSDGSDDGTDEIVGEFASRGVRLLTTRGRCGKEHAQGQAIRSAAGGILVFSDAGTRIPREAVRHLVTVLADSEVGAVSSVDRFISNDGRVLGEGMYVRYEMWLRQLESARGGLVGLSGSFFAARAEVCADWDEQSPSDFNVAINCRKLGLRSVSSSGMEGVYKDLADSAREYQRKLRTGIRGMSGLARHPEILSPRYGLFAFQIFSHKVMRWLVPWFLLLLFLVNLALLDTHLVYQLALAGQVAFYAAAAMGQWVPALRGNAVNRIIYYFVQVNVALAHAGVRFLAGERIQVWQPSRR